MDLIGKAELAPYAIGFRTTLGESALATKEVASASLVKPSPTRLGDTTSVGNGNDRYRRTRNPTPGDWEALRPIFSYYYKDKQMTLRAVSSMMKRQYGFVAR
jgi:Clr5 domain